MTVQIARMDVQEFSMTPDRLFNGVPKEYTIPTLGYLQTAMMIRNGPEAVLWYKVQVGVGGYYVDHLPEVTLNPDTQMVVNVSGPYTGIKVIAYDDLFGTGTTIQIVANSL